MTPPTAVNPSAPPIEPMELAVDDLPAELKGLTIGHLSDLHVRRPRRRFERLAEQLASCRPDMLAFTGDLCANPAGTDAALDVVRRIVNAAQPRLGSFCVFGNHDHQAFRDRLDELPVHCLVNRGWRDPDRPLDVLGVDCRDERFFGDFLATILDQPPRPGERRLRIVLAHSPAWLVCAADAGMDLVLCGHTHGGQVRLPGLSPLYVGGEQWPRRFYSGLFRCRRTVCVLSRGLGEQKIDGLRLFCPAHAPLITLRRADPTETSERTEQAGIHIMRRW